MRAPGRSYAVNSPTFSVGEVINTQQQNLRFAKHFVLLDGGIGMLVEGLLTYQVPLAALRTPQLKSANGSRQVKDVRRLILQLGDGSLNRSIQDVTKAELARVFASLHLEQVRARACAREPALTDPRRRRSPRAEREEVLRPPRAPACCGRSPAHARGQAARSLTACWASPTTSATGRCGPLHGPAAALCRC